jgi:hypothetical protein
MPIVQIPQAISRLGADRGQNLALVQNKMTIPSPELASLSAPNREIPIGALDGIRNFEVRKISNYNILSRNSCGISSSIGG